MHLEPASSTHSGIRSVSGLQMTTSALVGQCQQCSSGTWVKLLDVFGEHHMHVMPVDTYRLVGWLYLCCAAGVSSKAWAKLLDVFGDLEAAWQDSTRRQQFLSLPIK
jgi:hypothetical protein